MKISQTKAGLTAESTYPLKNGEGAIIEMAGEEEEGKYEEYNAYVNGKLYQYSHSKMSEFEMILFTSAEVSVDSSSGTYTLYQNSKAVVDTSESYLWFNEKREGCDLKPGKHKAKDVIGKCGIDFEVYSDDEYLFKKTADAGEAYYVDSESDVKPDYSSSRKYTVKSTSGITDIMNSYPQSSSVIIPSIMIVLAVLVLFL